MKRSGFGNKALFSASSDGTVNNRTEINLTGADQIALVSVAAGTTQFLYTSTQVLRDPSAWYHVVVAFDSTATPTTPRIYINGSEVTQFSLSPTVGASVQGFIGSNVTHRVGAYAWQTSGSFDGYLADIHLIDGQALDPTSFGEFDEDTGVWVPKAYTGTYGTNGFQLKFADNSNNTATTLGKDTSPNGNNWTPNNLSVTAGAGNDSLVDVPTNGTASSGGDAGGVTRGNYCTLNPLRIGANLTLSNGNLDITTGSTGSKIASSSIGVSSGKWYWEATLNASGEILIGIENGQASLSQYLGQNVNGWGYDSFNGAKYNNGSSSAYGNTFTTNDVIGVALDLDNGAIYFSKNGTWQNSGVPTSGASKTGAAYTSLPAVAFPAFSPYDSGSGCSANFGQRPFAYTAPSGFKALNTANLPVPTITNPSTVMDVKLYTGTGATQSITGLGFSPDLLWFKRRDASAGHALNDSVRGATKSLSSDRTDAEYTSSAGNDLVSFNSDGFTVGPTEVWNSYNVSGGSLVAWAWDAGSSTVTNTDGNISCQVRSNASAGFSIVTYTGTGSAATVGHGLGVAPQMVIAKARTGGGSFPNWSVYHVNIGAGSVIWLNVTNAPAANANYWNNIVPTSTVFSVGNDVNGPNASPGAYVAYCFAPVAGYSNAFSYAGNGSTDGVFQYLGFRARLIIVKRTDTTGDWYMWDTARNTFNLVNLGLLSNSNGAELSLANAVLDVNSNGFKLRGTDAGVNASGGSYIGFAWAEHPFQYSRAR